MQGILINTCFPPRLPVFAPALIAMPVFNAVTRLTPIMLTGIELSLILLSAFRLLNVARIHIRSVVVN